MSTLPRFLKRKRVNVAPGHMDSVTEQYRPLLAQWLIGLAIDFGWDKKPSGLTSDVLEDEDFLAVTGIRPPGDRHHCSEEVDTEGAGRLSQRARRALLRERLAELTKHPINADLPLFVNVERFGRLLGLNDAEVALLAFASAMHSFPGFRGAIAARCLSLSTLQLSRLIARLCGPPEHTVRTALSEDSPLVRTGILRVNEAPCDLEEKLDLMADVSAILLTPHANEELLVAKFLRPAEAAMLEVGDFPHLKTDIDLVLDYLQAVRRERTVGVNVLFYGPPGTGKSQLARAIAAQLEGTLYEVGFSDEQGHSLQGDARLRSYQLTQALLTRRQDAMLVFDEVEDVFPGASRWARLFGIEAPSARASGKASMNRTLESNATPAIWIMNEADVDPAYLRRFDYSLRCPVPPQAVRKQIACHHLGQLSPPDEWLARLSANEELSPGQYERAAKVAKLASCGDPDRALVVAEHTLQRSAALLGQQQATLRSRSAVPFDITLLNTDMDVDATLNGLAKRPSGSFCFYGPPGTGKSELARCIADRLGRPLLLRCASDLLSKWVGETEHRLAEMFAAAAEQDAVLLLDEADSFLGDRREARANWQVTQVNELLTRMEAFQGLFIATTNLMESLDPASLRRFSFKVEFRALTAAQRWVLFSRELERLGGEDLPSKEPWKHRLEALDGLSLGDFAVTARQFEVWDTPPTAESLYQRLRKECDVKGAGRRPIGFHA